MTYEEIFEAYYSLYRGEAQIPSSEEDEYLVGIPLANEAINRWANYDNTMWKELFTTLQDADDGDKTVTAGTDYNCPEDMKTVGGYVAVRNSDGATVRRYKIVEPQEAQFRGDSTSYAFFTGDPGNGYVMHLNPAPDSTIIGMDIDYVYYKKPTLFTTTSGDATEMPQPYFIVHRMLANRFRTSRNPYYGSAKTDAEDVLRTMQLENNSGNWASPWSVADNSGTSWGN
jgi:hypothetical protein